MAHGQKGIEQRQPVQPFGGDLAQAQTAAKWII